MATKFEKITGRKPSEIFSKEDSGKYVENAIADKINDGLDERLVDTGMTDDTAIDIVIADLTWQMGEHLNNKAVKHDGESDMKYLDFLTRNEDGESYDLTPDEVSQIMNDAKLAYSDPDFVLIQSPDGRIRWGDKKSARPEDNIARSVKQVIGGYAKAAGMTYKDVCDEIDPNYKYIKDYGKKRGNLALKVGDELIGGRLNDLNGDPQIASKDGAWRNAVLGDGAEGIATFMPVSPFVKGKQAMTAAKTLPKVVNGLREGAKAAGVGFAAGAGSNLAGQFMDAVAPSGYRYDREFDPKEAATAGLVGGVAGAGARAVAPMSNRAAGKTVLYNQSKNKPQFMEASKDELDNLYKAADRQVAARTGKEPWVYEPMNDPKFDTEFVAGEDFLPKRQRMARPDEPEAGKMFALEDNDLGATAAPKGKSGIELVESNAKEIAEQEARKVAAQKNIEKTNADIAKINNTSLPSTVVSSNDNQLAMVNHLIQEAEAAGEDATKLRLMRAKLIDDNAKRAAAGANRDAKITSGNTAIDQRVANLYQQKANAQAILDETPIVPKREYKLTQADERLADEWAGQVNKKYDIGMSPANAKKFLANSQGGPSNPEYQMAHGTLRLPRKELNARRGRLATKSDDLTYDQNLYDLYGQMMPEGVSVGEWSKAKNAVSKREGLTEGANSKDDLVGGPDFHKKKAKLRGKYAMARDVGAGVGEGLAKGGSKLANDDYYMDFVPTKH